MRVIGLFALALATFVTQVLGKDAGVPHRDPRAMDKVARPVRPVEPINDPSSSGIGADDSMPRAPDDNDPMPRAPDDNDPMPRVPDDDDPMPRGPDNDDPMPRGPTYYMSRAELESYLSRSISIQGLLKQRYSGGSMELYNRWLTALTDVMPKFMGRAATIWGAESRLADGSFHGATALMVQDIHLIDPDIVVQGAIFEFVNNDLGGWIQIPIPQHCFNELGYTRSHPGQVFHAANICTDPFPDQPNGCIPDLAKPEAQMWFYHRARLFIDDDVEAIHLGQVNLMTMYDNNLAGWCKMMGVIRHYAGFHARRQFVLLDAHTYGKYCNGRLAFDFHSFPVRPDDTSGTRSKGNALAGVRVHEPHSIYGNSLGGTTYMGWSTYSLPYLVELDNYGVSEFHAGQHTGPNGPDSWLTWGRDEISWFAVQSNNFRKYVQQYFWFETKCIDSAAFFQFAAIRGITIEKADPWPRPEYHAIAPFSTSSYSLPSPDTNGDGRPDYTFSSGPAGYDDLAMIGRLWRDETTLFRPVPLISNLQINPRAAALHPDGQSLYYATLAGEMYSFNKDQSSGLWQHAPLGHNGFGSLKNVDYSIKIDISSEALFYVGTDKRVHIFYKNGLGVWWQTPLLASAPANVGGELQVSPGKVYYRGTDGRVHNYYYRAGQWKYGSLRGQPNVAGPIRLGSHGKIFYRGTDRRVWLYYWDPSFASQGQFGWRQTPLSYGHCEPVSLTDGENGQIHLRSDASQVFYKSDSGRIGTYLWNQVTGQWDCSTFGSPLEVKDNLVVRHDKVFFRTRFNQVGMYYYEHNLWLLAYDGFNNHDHYCAGVYRPLADSLHVSPDAKFVFWRSGDGKLEHSWWDGQQWVCEMNWECDKEIKPSAPGAGILEAGNTLFLLGSDNVAKTLEYADKW